MTNADYIKTRITDKDLMGAIEGSALGALDGIFFEAWCVWDAWQGRRGNRTKEVNFLNWLNLKFDEKTWKEILDSEEYR